MLQMYLLTYLIVSSTVLRTYKLHRDWQRSSFNNNNNNNTHISIPP